IKTPLRERAVEKLDGATRGSRHRRRPARPVASSYARATLGSAAGDDGELAAWLVDLAGRGASRGDRDGVVGMEVEAFAGVEGERDVALEQDERLVVRELPSEARGVGGEEGRGEERGCHADRAKDVGTRVGLAGEDIVAEVVRDPAVV